MILGFKERFVPKIIEGSKIHSIRVDQHRRWKPGMKIHLATGVRTKNYKQFDERTCFGVQEITMDFTVAPNLFVVDGKPLTTLGLLRLIENDGFYNYMELWTFFSKNGKVDKFSGVIIHWTTFLYGISEKEIQERLKNRVLLGGDEMPEHLKEWAYVDWSKDHRNADEMDHATDALRYVSMLPQKPISLSLIQKIANWIRDRIPQWRGE